jgi:polar amino acid transport system substrate-binding protein
MGELPQVIESADSGPFADLLKAIDEVYTDGVIVRRMFPFVRSMDNVLAGRADFHIPMLRDPTADGAELPYRFASEKLGVVEFVLYSNVANPLTAERIHEGLRNPAGFPYRIEALRGTLKTLANLPIKYNSEIERSLQLVAAGRIDALVAPQEEGDHALRRVKLKAIRRELYMGFDDVIVIPKGPRGDEVDAALSAAIRELKASGRWNRLYRAVHRPYENWQPADQRDW